ncbi:MAG: sulfite exporter TauE/SafE family protein [Planctomycetaceae bacterium]|nr:sulfite exporter TauE/SafE family protein [Planctomycetaceae bacterium]
MEYVYLLALGVGVGTFGTLIGAGGGFILMPILLLMYPSRAPTTLTAISLAMVFFNASSGSYSYARMKRIDFKSGLLFLVTGVPGAAAGAYLVRYIPRHVFEFVFGMLLLGVASYIFIKTFDGAPRSHGRWATFKRTIIDAQGVHHEYAFSLALGMAISFGVGLASSILGIGGGIIHVPAMVNLLDFPVHIATATSHFILAAMTLVGTLVHVIDGSLGRAELPELIMLGGGAIAGAQVGAALSRRVHGRWIMRSLAGALGLVSIRILIPGTTALFFSH